jgi:hypothetical protein
MDKLGQFILRGWRHASLFIFGVSLLPLIGFLSTVFLSLFTLRKSEKSGLLLVSVTSLPFLALSLFYSFWFFAPIFIGLVSTYFLSLILKATNRWSAVLLGLVLLAHGLFFLAHFFLPEINAAFSHYLSSADTQNLPPEEIALLQKIAPYSLGIVFLFFGSNAFFSVFLARYWQAKLFKPEGFSPEWQGIRLSYLFLALVVCDTAIAFLYEPAFINLLFIDIFCMAIASFSLLHYVFAKQQRSKVWLWISYIIFFLGLPFSLLFLIVSVIDALFNYRRKIP